MAQMVRKQIYIEQRQEAALKRLARARGVSEAEVIRRAIDSQATGSDTQPTDAQAWAEALAFMEQLAQRGSADRAPIQWSREELYEERLARRV